MTESLKVLLIEDSPSDAALVARELHRVPREVESMLVTNAEQLAEALRSTRWDAVLSDYSLPGFDAQDASQVASLLAAQLRGPAAYRIHKESAPCQTS